MTTDIATPSTASKPRTGRRKESVARVRLMPGAGKSTINDRTPLDYLKRETLVQNAFHALTLTNLAAKYGVIARVHFHDSAPSIATFGLRPDSIDQPLHLCSLCGQCRQIFDSKRSHCDSRYLITPIDGVNHNSLHDSELG